MTKFGGLLVPDRLLDRKYAAGLLRAYLVRDGNRCRYSGAAFDDYPAPQGTENRITDSDLIAIAMLGIKASGHESLWITQYDADRIQELLMQIPSNVRIDDETAADLLQRGQAAWTLWTLLRDIRDHTKPARLGPVAAGKLLARKRPELIPIADSRTAGVFNRPEPGVDETWWDDVRSASLDGKLAADDLPLWLT